MKFEERALTIIILSVLVVVAGTLMCANYPGLFPEWLVP